MIRQQLFDQPSFIPVFEDFSTFRKKSIGITGASGVLGHIISKRFADNKVDVISYNGDITDEVSLHKWFEKNSFDLFFHFAAIVPLTRVQEDPFKAYEVNTIGTYYICKEIIKKQHSCRFFAASSSHVYKNQTAGVNIFLKENSIKEPKSIYGMTKLAAEQVSIPILEQYKISYCFGRIFSFTSLLQPESYLVPALRKKINETPENGTVNVINSDCIRDIIDAETVIDCVLHLAVNDYIGVVNIGSGKGMRIMDIAEHIARLAGKNIHFNGENKIVPDSLVADVNLLKKILKNERN